MPNQKSKEEMKMRKRLVMFLAVLSIIGFLLPNVSDAGDTIKVGILGPMTGPNVDIGCTMRDGAILAMEEFNEKGGIRGKKFEWVIVDDEASPAKSVIGARKLISKDNVDLIIGPANSGCALAVGEVTVPSKIVNIVPGQNAKMTTPDRDYVFRCSITDKEIAKKMMEFLGTEFKKIALIHDTTGYGEHWYQTLLGLLKSRGITPVADESFEVDIFDLTPQVTRIKQSGAEILVFLGVGGDVPTLAKAERRIGLSIPHLGTNGFGCQTVIDLGAEDVEGYIFPDTVDLNKEQWQIFRDKYRKRFNIPVVFTHHPPPQAYDAVYMLAQALEKTNGESGEALKNAIEQGVAIDGATCKVGTGGMSWKKGKQDAMVAEQLAMIQIRNGRFVSYVAK
jgi:branched-chain amino acid transport system substrate-binding protein